MANARMNALFTSLEQHAERRSLELFEARCRIARLEARNQELERHSRELQQQMTQLAEQARAARSDFKPARSKAFAALMERRPRRDLPQEASQNSPPHEAAQMKALQVEDETLPSEVESGAPSPQSETAPASAVSTSAASTSATAALTTTQRDAISPQALLNQWYQRYTATFFKGHTRPLKVGIHEELMTREPWPEKLVRRALACYVHLPRYLKAVRENAQRVGLDGEAAGLVNAAEAAHAHQKLEELRAKKRNDVRRSDAPRSITMDKSINKRPDQPAAKFDKTPRKSEQLPKENTVPSQATPPEPKNFEQKLSDLVAKHQK